jgi:DNA (cytosine-5)-methyltransferase 1
MKKQISFIDLFCGIGGFHEAMKAIDDKLMSHCVFSSDIDKDVQLTYANRFGLKPKGDITLIDAKDMPSHDILFAGFPCQAFSVAGFRKGLDDPRGLLFFDVLRIATYHSPSVLLLENVKGLLNHDSGKTFLMMITALNNIGYEVHYKVLNTAEYGNIPQNRERVYIVATRKKIDDPFPSPLVLTKKIHDCILKDKQSDYFYYNSHRYYPILDAHILNADTIYQWRRHYVRENKNQLCPTLTANMGTGGHNIPLIRDSFGIRKLTPRECLRFQGFDDTFTFPAMALSKQYKQIGNSISVPVAKRILERVLPQIF